MTIQVFIDIAPAKSKRVCNNSKNFDLTGIGTGYCRLKKKIKCNYQYCKEIDLK